MVRNVILLVVVVAVVTVTAQRKLINGETAHLGEFPYMVSFGVDGEHKCGGTIISDNFVLTAAHCINESLIIDPSSASVLYGVVNRNTRTTNTARVKRVIIHKDYKPPVYSYPHDIALLELKEKIEFGSNVQPVNLTNPGAYPGYNIFATLAGWGMTWFGKPFSQSLFKNDITLVTAEFCENAWQNMTTYYPELQLCGYFHNKGTGACHGDAGGPLLINGIQVGITSWGSGKCVIGTPTVFTNVGHYRNWIKENSGV